MSKKRENLYYVVAGGLVLIALFIDIYLANNAGAKVIDPENLAHHFSGSLFDWVGIILFNASLLSLAAGLAGVFELLEMPNSTKYNWIFFGVTVASLIMIVA